MSYAPGAFITTLLVALPVMLHVYIIHYVLVIYMQEKMSATGSAPMPYGIVIPDVVVGLLSTFLVLAPAWPVVPWLPAIFPESLPAVHHPPADKEAQHHRRGVDMPLINRKEAVQLALLLSLGVGIVTPFINHAFSPKAPKKFVFSHSFFGKPVRFGPEPYDKITQLLALEGAEVQEVGSQLEWVLKEASVQVSNGDLADILV